MTVRCGNHAGQSIKQRGPRRKGSLFGEGFRACARVCRPKDPASTHPRGKSFAEQTDHVPAEQATHMRTAEDSGCFFQDRLFGCRCKPGVKGLRVRRVCEAVSNEYVTVCDLPVQIEGAGATF
jgi:hypothetical protein